MSRNKRPNRDVIKGQSAKLAALGVIFSRRGGAIVRSKRAPEREQRDAPLGHNFRIDPARISDVRGAFRRDVANSHGHFGRAGEQPSLFWQDAANSHRHFGHTPRTAMVILAGAREQPMPFWHWTRGQGRARSTMVNEAMRIVRSHVNGALTNSIQVNEIVKVNAR